MRIDITPDSNVDYDAWKVIDNSKISTVVRDWEEEAKIFNVPTQEVVSVHVQNLSMRDHLLIIDGVRHKMLHLFSTPK